MKDHTDLLIDFDLGDANPQDLVQWAIDQIQRGKNTENLMELAWKNNPLNSEARELYLCALEELQYELPSRTNRRILTAKKIAANILSGEKDINDGCSELCEISRELNSPEYLSIFELLAHEQYDHESLGINKNNIQPEIRAAAEALLNNA